MVPRTGAQEDRVREREREREREEEESSASSTYHSYEAPRTAPICNTNTDIYSTGEARQALKHGI
jgi:hypothetical protein